VTAPPSPAPPRKGRGIRWWSGLLLLAGIVLFALILARESPEEVLAACLTAGPGFLLVLIAPLGYFVLHTWGWLVLMPGRRPGFWKALHAYIASQALDELGGGVLGEPLKVFVVPGDDRTEGIAAVTLDNLSLIVSLGLYLGLGGLILSIMDVQTIPLGEFAPTVLGVLGAAAAIGALFLLGPELLGRRIAARLSWEALTRFLARYEEVAKHNRRFLVEHPMRFATSVWLHILAKAWIIVEVWITLQVMSLYEPGRAVWLGLGKQFVQLAGAPIPAQVGVFTGTLAYIGESLGMVGSVALAVALLRRARSLVWIVIGLALVPGVSGSTGSGPARPR
jgi:hypothetical protein